VIPGSCDFVVWCLLIREQSTHESKRAAISTEQKSAKKIQIYATLKRTPAELAIFIGFFMARIVRANQPPAL
jgi:hypothetical protein